MKRILTILSLLWSFSVVAQQDPLYNQYQFNQLMINPAYAGIYERLSIGLISRVQWAGVDGAPVTNTLTGSTSLLRGKVGAGLTAIYDRFGVNENIEIQAAYAYILDVGVNTRLSMGLQTGLINYKYNYLDLNLEYLDDPDLLPTEENFTEPNFGAGLMLLGERFFIGASVPRILNVEVHDGSTTSTRYRKHYYLSGGVMIFPSTAVKLKFTGLLRYVDNNPLSLDLSSSLLLGEAIWAGVIVRNMSGVGLFGLFEVNDKIRLGYSFELPTTQLVRNNYGTHELSISIDFDVFSGQQLIRRYF
ncbi:type IX secretion system membrane protein PorP/SprF [Fulvivirga sp. RKSG066]|uniref:PorP/SprF family type IX secretion system membrane protein n=1 Tax=Fulvivirga aurantia TaxID=2529383 RepID=UPI0012BC927E|nr:type IX secretion system membrane protein PorP/SprF [Fulvivirga aurantia]MTI20249.1 type IX secretion system membrane protein PorP/SprF [Fulvivirga aurantia]